MGLGVHGLGTLRNDRRLTDLDIPVNHSPRFAPVIQPTLDTGTQALIVAALACL